MEIVLNFLLNYITLAVAGIAFVIILVVLFAKRKSLSRSTKLIFTVLLIILAVYFVLSFGLRLLREEISALTTWLSL